MRYLTLILDMPVRSGGKMLIFISETWKKLQRKVINITEFERNSPNLSNLYNECNEIQRFDDIE